MASLAQNTKSDCKADVPGITLFLANSIILIRAALPADASGLERMFYRLSPTSISRWLFIPAQSHPRWAAVLASLANVDYQDQYAVVALVEDEIIGIARYDRGPTLLEAELGIIIEDAWQSRGIGKLLLTFLIIEARRQHIQTFTAMMLSENRPALRLLASSFGQVGFQWRSGECVARAGLETFRPAPLTQKLLDLFASNRGEVSPMSDTQTETRTRTIAWQDPLPSAQLSQTMSGLHYLRAIQAGEIPPPPIAVLMGMSIDEVEEGRVIFSAQPAEYHYNPIGVVHGGLAATLLDSSLGCAVHSMLPAGTGYTTLEIKVNYVRPITSETGELRCEGKVIHLGGRIATAGARITDASGKLYAHGTTTCIIFRP